MEKIKPIQEFQTDELLAELENRFDNMVFSGSYLVKKGEERRRWAYKGVRISKCRDLCYLLLNEIIEDYYCEKGE